VPSKIHRLREQMVKTGSPGTVVSQLDEVAWLLNLRGSDIPYNPVSHQKRGHLVADYQVFFAYAILTMNECALFTNSDSIDDTAKSHLQTGGVTVLPYGEIWSYLATWGQQLSKARESSQPPTELKLPEPKDGEKKNADPTNKASISGKTSWAVAEALGKVSCLVFCSFETDI
jgi:Xaa-Pro aminopeptidase